MNNDYNIFICDCGDLDHQLIIKASEEEKELYLFIKLNKFTWLKRLKVALLYLLGKECDYGSFQEIILNKNRIIEIKCLLEEYLVKID